MYGEDERTPLEPPTGFLWRMPYDAAGYHLELVAYSYSHSGALDMGPTLYSEVVPNEQAIRAISHKALKYLETRQSLHQIAVRINATQPK